MKPFIRHLFLLFGLVTVSGFLATAQSNPNQKITFAATADSLTSPEYKDEVQTVEDEFKKIGFNISPLLNDPRFKIYEGIDDRFENSAEDTSPDIKEYKDILGFEYKVAKIDEFMENHSETLNKAEKKYGISKFIIAAILGIESNFGTTVGSHNPFNVYVSMLVLDYRTEFARTQLKHLLMFTEKEEIDVLSLKSSYAGAMGYAQFIPYSLTKWWVGDKIFDMTNSIYSVANYLSYFKKRVDNIEEAVLRYNPSSLYVKAVMALAEAAKKEYSLAK